MFCASQLYVCLLRHLPRFFPKKWLRLQKLQFFISQSSLPSLEGDNNLYILYIYIIIYYYYLQSVSTPKSLVPPPLKTVTSVTVTTVTVFAHFRK